MGIKCSIFGHRFADPDIERQREERGSEVVVTITETETCTRCGSERVVSENTEVTTLEPDDSLASDVEERDTEPITSGAEETSEAGPTDAGPADPEPESTEIIEDAEGGSVETAGGSVDADPTSEDSAHTTADAGAAPVEETDPETDDAVILEDDADDEPEEREPGQWPQEDEPEDRTESAADVVSDEELADSLVEPGETEGEGPSPGGSVPEGTFVCEECGFTTEIESSSLREGDFCPECQRGTLTAGPSE